jgi:hypothetical protein
MCQFYHCPSTGPPPAFAHTGFTSMSWCGLRRVISLLHNHVSTFLTFDNTKCIAYRWFTDIKHWDQSSFCCIYNKIYKIGKLIGKTKFIPFIIKVLCSNLYHWYSSVICSHIIHICPCMIENLSKRMKYDVECREWCRMQKVWLTLA